MIRKHSVSFFLNFNDGTANKLSNSSLATQGLESTHQVLHSHSLWPKSSVYQNDRIRDFKPSRKYSSFAPLQYPVRVWLKKTVARELQAVENATFARPQLEGGTIPFEECGTF